MNIDNTIKEFGKQIAADFEGLGTEMEEIGRRYTAMSEAIALDLINGAATVEDAESALEALATGLQSEALVAAYTAHEKTVAATRKALVFGFKILAAALA